MYNDVYLEKLALQNLTVSYVHAAPGFVNTNWGTEMPFFLRALIRPLQSLLGKSASKCAENMVRGMKGGNAGGLNLVDENGGVGKAKVCKGHEEGKERIWKYLTESIGPWCE